MYAYLKSVDLRYLACICAALLIIAAPAFVQKADAQAPSPSPSSPPKSEPLPDFLSVPDVPCMTGAEKAALEKLAHSYEGHDLEIQDLKKDLDKNNRQRDELTQQLKVLQAELRSLQTPQSQTLMEQGIIPKDAAKADADKISAILNNLAEVGSNARLDEINIRRQEEERRSDYAKFEILVNLIRKRCPPPQAAPSGGGGRYRYVFASSQTHFGVFVGGAMVTGLPTTSSSGFFDGNLDHGAASLGAGGSAFVDLAKFGTSPGAFGTYTLSGGVVVDYFGGTSLQYHGECGGLACMGTGHLSELNAIAELKLTTPISPRYTINGYLGVGSATVWPTGQPTGAGGPNFLGSATAAAFRVGCGFDQQLAPNLSAGFKVGFQHTGSTEYDTTLPGERFRIDSKNEVIFGATLTWTPSSGP
jgi:hypothetical protein